MSYKGAFSAGLVQISHSQGSQCPSFSEGQTRARCHLLLTGHSLELCRSLCVPAWGDTSLWAHQQPLPIACPEEITLPFRQQVIKSRQESSSFKGIKIIQLLLAERRGQAWFPRGNQNTAPPGSAQEKQLLNWGRPQRPRLHCCKKLLFPIIKLHKNQQHVVICSLSMTETKMHDIYKRLYYGVKFVDQTARNMGMKN